MKFIQTNKYQLTDKQFTQVSQLKHFLSKGNSKLTDDIIRILKIIYPIKSRVKSAYDGDTYKIDHHTIHDTSDPDRIYVNCTLYLRTKDLFSLILAWPDDYLISEEDWNFLSSLGLVKHDSTILENYYTL